jgi:hypothetical protein
MGDCMIHDKSGEIKLGHTAQVNAHLVVDNIKRLELGSKPLTYPEAVTGGGPTPKIYCISLGKYDASLGFSWLVVNGKLAGFMKWLLEWTQVQAADEKPIGTVFWKVATSCLRLCCLLFPVCCMLFAVSCLQSNFTLFFFLAITPNLHVARDTKTVTSLRWPTFPVSSLGVRSCSLPPRSCD